LNSRSPNQLHHVVKDQDKGVADQKLHQDVAAVDAAHEDTFEDEAEDGGAGRAAEHRQRETPGDLIGGHREIGAEHVERAVAENSRL